MLFSEKPVIRFVFENNTCPVCGKRLKIYKTKTKDAATLEIGHFTLHETIKRCDSCQTVFKSDEPRRLVPHFCRFGFNVLVYVGHALFIEYKSENQIQCELGEKNIIISLRQISYLSQKYIIYLALSHKESQANIRDLLFSKGGYTLHLDGTCEGDSPHLMTALDEVSNIVLSNIKIPSEKASKIIPFLKQIKEDYGPPIALVHDMGKGILSAVREVFPGAADFICHFHFLRDIGNDLLNMEYTKIRNALSKAGIRSNLRSALKQCKEEVEQNEELTTCIETYLKSEDQLLYVTPIVWAYIQINWIMDANSECDGYGFPFDRPHLVFYSRMQKVKRLIGILPSKIRQNRYIADVNRLITPLSQDKTLNTVSSRLDRKVILFDELRKTMRIAAPNDKEGLNDGDNEVDIMTIKAKVAAFRHSNHVKIASDKNPSVKKMVKQIDNYWEKLFADPITITTPNGEKQTLQPQRTNNILERFFRDVKRMYRRRNGTMSLTRTIKAMIADTSLVT